MKRLSIAFLSVVGCASTQDIGNTLLDASVLGPRLAAARESRQVTEEKYSITAIWISPTTLRVNGSGSPATSVAQVEDQIMLLAAQKALEAGFSVLVPYSYEDTSVLSNYTVNSPYETSFSGETRGHVVGNTYHSATEATAVTTGGPRTRQLLLPGRVVDFMLLNSVPDQYRPGQYFDALSTYNDLGPTYIRGFRPVRPTE